MSKFAFLSKLSVPSQLRYALWRAGGCRSAVTLQLASGVKFELRAGLKPARDYGVAYEVFVHGYYNLPKGLIEATAVRTVYDLGCNVGLTCLHWLGNYPNARIVGFEPHPANIAQLKTNLALNGWGDRVELHESAASVRSGIAKLTDAGPLSQVLPATKRGIDIRMEDFFERSLKDDIDILKIDIEGSEYPLMEDTRFDRLRARILVIEWHLSKGDWTRSRLRECGYKVTNIFDYGVFGMLLATKR